MYHQTSIYQFEIPFLSSRARIHSHFLTRRWKRIGKSYTEAMRRVRVDTNFLGLMNVGGIGDRE